MTDFPKRTAAFAEFVDFLTTEVPNLHSRLRIGAAADEVISIAAAEAFDIASNIIKEALSEIKVKK